jgi:hypothetical protein
MPLVTYGQLRGCSLMPLVIITPRDKLRNFLEGQLKLIGKSKSSEWDVLRRAVEGLVALDYGESQPMFVPGDRKGSHDGTRPYTLRKLQMQALGYADLLIKHKYKGEHAAIRTVAHAYKQSANTFRGWRKSKRLGMTRDLLMQSYRKEVAERDWDETHILDELEAAGNKFREVKKLAHKSKK